ncbi:MAG: hypothetical protein GX492_01685 [Firmicutes bacterium]|nr:hypothetical protein [Bacillota bacterium]
MVRVRRPPHPRQGERSTGATGAAGGDAGHGRGMSSRRAALPLVGVLVAVAVAAWGAAGVYLRARHAAPEGSPSAVAGQETVPGGVAPGRSEQAQEHGEGGDALPGASMILERTKIVVPGPSGEPEWEFSAGKIEIAKERQVARLTGVEGARYVNGVTQAHVRAQVLTADLASGRLEFEGGIEVASEGGAGFSARQATWDPVASRFTASGDVRYSDGRSTIIGDTIQVDAGLEEAIMKGRVKFSTVVRGG